MALRFQPVVEEPLTFVDIKAGTQVVTWPSLSIALLVKPPQASWLITACFRLFCMSLLQSISHAQPLSKEHRTIRIVCITFCDLHKDNIMLCRAQEL